MDRYTGKPFLRLLECYILDLIGQLDDKQKTILKTMEPKLFDVYGEADDWQQVVVREMDIPESFDSQVRSFWAGYQDDARSRGVAADPGQFAVAFVDQNF